MLFVKRFFKKLRKTSTIASYSRNGEGEIYIKNDYFNVEIAWEFENMDLIFTREDGTRINYSKTDYPEDFKRNVKSIINGYLDTKAKLAQLDNLLFSYFIETK